MRESTARPAPLPIRHGDTVRIMSGRSKGKTGKVLSVNPLKRTVTVEHANIIKKHTRPNPSKNIKGGILDKEGPIHVSNVLLVCTGCGTLMAYPLFWITNRTGRRSRLAQFSASKNSPSLVAPSPDET